jgi:glycogen debranching enzyme
MKTQEEIRLDEVKNKAACWRLWGPYLSERQWGTVREDYSEDGEAWVYFPHDSARSRAYRWGEDGLGGICDEHQRLCFALALWNGKDPIIKERLFGLTGKEGNHGEDVKEYYFYLDNTPTHAYMKYLYKYPQSAYPYEDLVEENKRRSRHDPEYELLDTKVFDQDKYYDVFIEYAKASDKDIAIKIEVVNRSDTKEILHLLPTLWFRNSWSWSQEVAKPRMWEEGASIVTTHPELESYALYYDTPQEILFTENNTNTKKLFGIENLNPYVKDSFHSYLIDKDIGAVNPKKEGTKAALHYVLTIEPKKSSVIYLRLCQQKGLTQPINQELYALFAKRKEEADLFYQKRTPFSLSDEMRSVQRQAFAGLLWNKQYYRYDVNRWLQGDPNFPPPSPNRKAVRNKEWANLNTAEVLSMPDKWEYPWFASWDLAFHAISFAVIDPDFAKQQMRLLTKEWYMHPNGELPAYEWSFSDANPPVEAFAALRIYQIEQNQTGVKDRKFLEEMFQKLSLNFTWWVNRKDADGRNIFEGGFLGLDNISAFDRTTGPPGGGTLYQVDGTAWMAMYALNLLQIALELAIEDPVYEHMATKFFEHFIYIAGAMNDLCQEGGGLWNEQDGAYHAVLVLPDGSSHKVSSTTIIGVIPLYAVATSDGHINHVFPEYRKRFSWFLEHHPKLMDTIVEVKKTEEGAMLFSLVNQEKLRRILSKTFDPAQLLSPYGVRSVSKELEKTPFCMNLAGKEYVLNYEPAESTTGLFGGNSNWRGPVWFPLNYLLIESLQKFHYFLGKDFTIEFPTGSGNFLNLWEISFELSSRLIEIFMPDGNGRRPVYGGTEKFQSDPHFKEYVLFHEYFHGDNGAGLGASHQLGWTGLVAKLIYDYGRYKKDHQRPMEMEKNKLGSL